MQSINSEVTALPTADTVLALAKAYNDHFGFEMPLMSYHERLWFDGVKAGLTPAMLALVLEDRQRRIRKGIRNQESLYVHNLVGDEQRIAETINEAFALMAQGRIKRIDPGRCEVLRATGRPTEAPTMPAQASKEVIAKLAEEFRRAAQ